MNAPPNRSTNFTSLTFAELLFFSHTLPPWSPSLTKGTVFFGRLACHVPLVQVQGWESCHPCRCCGAHIHCVPCQIFEFLRSNQWTLCNYSTLKTKCTLKTLSEKKKDKDPAWSWGQSRSSEEEMIDKSAFPHLQGTKIRKCFLLWT